MLLQAAQAAAGAQHYPAPALYVVATPIGNLADLTLRAVHVLALADTVACEDTRVAARLLQHLGLDAPRLAVHAHNEHESAAAVVDRLRAGQRVAFISDAGTPGVSDPGAVLVRETRAAGVAVVPVPGVSSATTAASVAADIHARGFRFIGFLPAKGAERAQTLQAALREGPMLIVFEAPHRIETLARELAALCPQRTLTVCRELTKQFEAIDTLAAGEWPAWQAQDAHRIRGEFVVVVHAAVPGAAGGVASTAQAVLRELLTHVPLKQAVALVAEATGEPRNALYALALDWKGEGRA